MAQNEIKKLGIVAGGGALPAALIRHCQETGRPFFVLALKGHANAALLPADVPVAWIRPGAVGMGFRLCHQHNVQEIVLIGSVRRPSVTELCPDWRAWAFLTRLGLRALGDDGLLRAVISEIETEGFQVRGIHELMPELLAPEGVLGKIEPDAVAQADIERGLKTACLLGEADVGQAVVVQQGIVLAVEGVEGTQALIKRSRELHRKGVGGVLIKIVKPNQERRVDLPTIGPQTIADVQAAGLRGICVEVGGVLIVDLEQTIRAADAAGIFILGVKK